MKKKGMFYTIAAVALTIVIGVTYYGYTGAKLNERMDVVQIRIDTVNFFIKDVERDLDKGSYISGFRALLSLMQHISANGTYIDDVDKRFKELFLNGTFGNQPIVLMQGSTFNDWANKISIEANKIDIKFNYTINDVVLNHTDPWSVDININITLFVSDNKNTSLWARNKHIVTKISIIGFEDPIYLINSNGRVTNPITISNISSFVTGGEPANLLVHSNNSYYISHNDSPSFIMRLEGILQNSGYGIESLVNLDEFGAAGIPLNDRSIVDYIYFGSQVTADYRINKTPDWFKIDSEHLDTYGVTNITI